MNAFHPPPLFDGGATFVAALGGGLLAARRGYDIVGTFSIALVSATGGGLLRDGLFLHQAPMLITNWLYLAIVIVATLLVGLFGTAVKYVPWYIGLSQVADSLSLGAYAVVGMSFAIDLHLDIFGAVLVGIVNAVGGGVLRDLLLGEQPRIFKPGEVVAIASVIGCSVFALARFPMHLNPHASAWIAIAIVFLVRTVAIRFGWRSQTLPVYESEVA
jgi:uncharacterized membrane protein YeiH